MSEVFFVSLGNYERFQIQLACHINLNIRKQKKERKKLSKAQNNLRTKYNLTEVHKNQSYKEHAQMLEFDETRTSSL